MALRRLVILAILALIADRAPARADSAEGISYRTQIIVPGDPDLASEMHDISHLVAKEGAKVDSELTLRRRATADLDQLAAAAHAAGYYDAELAYDLDSKSRPWRVSVKVKLGTPYRLREIRVVTPQGDVPPLAERFDPATLGLELGIRARSAPVIEAEAKLLGYYTTRGRPLARVTGHEAIIDRADHSMHITYTIVVGPSAAFGKAEINGLKAVDRRFVLNRRQHSRSRRSRIAPYERVGSRRGWIECDIRLSVSRIPVIFNEINELRDEALPTARSHVSVRLHAASLMSSFHLA